MKRLLCIMLALAVLFSSLTGCSNTDSETGDTRTENSTGGSQSTTGSTEMEDSEPDEDMFTNRDLRTEYSESGAITIELNGDSASASSDSVKISGTTITITEDATHIITGTLNDGQIIVQADDSAKLQLVFNGVNIHSETSAALYILSADKVFVTLAEGTENTLSNGGTFEAVDENNIDGAVFSKQDLTFNGSGALTVTSPAGHGIVCKDDLVFTGGTYTITSASHGMDANDSVRTDGADITIDAGKDGIHCENSDDAALGFIYISSGRLTIEAEGDGVDAGAYLQIEGGTIGLLAGGGYENGSSQSSGSYGGFMGGGRPGGMGQSSSSSSSSDDSTSMKGLKAANGIVINGGVIFVDSADDAIHSDTDIKINGGTLELASGDDGVHAEQTLTITNCTMSISQCYEGLEALDIDVRDGDFTIKASDDGLNAAGGTDSSGTTGGRDGMFGGGGGFGGGGFGSSTGGSIEISGGNFSIYSGGDCLDSNGSLLISGGYVYATNYTSGDVSVLDSETSAEITGGTFIGLGISTMMAMTFTSAEQGVIACTCGSQAAGSQLTVTDSDGKEILSMTTEYSTCLLIISTPEIVRGESYNISIGSISGSIDAG